MERIAAATLTRMAKRLIVLVGVLAVMLAVAIPALAQEAVGPTQNEPAATPAQEEAARGGTAEGETATGARQPAQETSTEGGGSTDAPSSGFRSVYTAVGVLERLGPDPSGDPTPTYSITDEETGASYKLISGFLDLEPFVGERVLVYGVPGAGLPAPGGGPRGLNVTEVVPLGESGETVTVTFELAVDGEVPEGQTLAMRLGSGSPSRFYEGPPGEVAFCATNGNPNFPTCEDGGTYSGTLEVPAGEPIPFDYVRLGNGGEAFYSDTRTFDEDSTVRVAYDADSEDGGEGGSTTPGEPSDGGGSGSGGGSGNTGSGGGSSSSDSSGSGSSSGGSDDNTGSGGSGADSGSSDSGSSDSGSSDSGSSDSGSSGSDGSGSGDSGNDAESSGSPPGGVTSGVRGLLPSTGGGVALWVLGAGILLIGGGLLIRKLAR